MFRNSNKDLKSVWFFIDVSEGFIVIFEGFVLLLGELFHSSVPFPLDFVKGLVNFSFDPSLFPCVIVFLFAFSLVLGDFPIGRGRRGRGCEGRGGFLCFESSLVWDSDGEWWW